MAVAEPVAVAEVRVAAAMVVAVVGAQGGLIAACSNAYLQCKMRRRRGH